MVAAQLFNQRQGNAIDYIMGVVIIGTDWKSLRLVGQNFKIDKRDYYIIEINQILRILSLLFSFYNCLKLVKNILSYQFL
jgi:hypothetical protein